MIHLYRSDYDDMLTDFLKATTFAYLTELKQLLTKSDSSYSVFEPISLSNNHSLSYGCGFPKTILGKQVSSLHKQQVGR